MIAVFIETGRFLKRLTKHFIGSTSALVIHTLAREFLNRVFRFNYVRQIGSCHDFRKMSRSMFELYALPKVRIRDSKAPCFSASIRSAFQKNVIRQLSFKEFINNCAFNFRLKYGCEPKG